VTARRDLRKPRDATTRSTAGVPSACRSQEWEGGERYGGEADRYYAEFRGTVRGTRPGDSVEVWFTGNRPGTGPRTSERFTYRLQQDADADVLVVANEDYEGVNPDQRLSVRAPEHATPT
jgi:hypothetical protein